RKTSRATMEPIQKGDLQAFLVKYDSVASAWDFRDERSPIGIDRYELTVRHLREDLFKAGKGFGSGVTFFEVLEQATQIGDKPFEILHTSGIDLAVLGCQWRAADREVRHGEQGQSKLVSVFHATPESLLSSSLTNARMVGVRGFEPPAPCSQSRCATGLRHTPTRHRAARRGSISPVENAPGGPHGAAAVIDASFFLRRQLRERARARRIVEDWVVAEPVGAARCLGDQALDDALRQVLVPRGIDEGDHAAEARRPLLSRNAGEGLEEARAAAPVVEAGAAVARRAHAGRAAERVHLEPGIVAERPGALRARHRARF